MLLYPNITVFMAVYNGAPYIQEAIQSILSQTYSDFELLIIDDGSTDNSLELISTYTDKRIRVLQNNKNLGLFKTRNRGIGEARGKFFATLDCDDIAYPDRLQVQISYFERNSDCKVCGGRIKYINDKSSVIGRSSQVDNDVDYLRALMLFTNFFINSTTMIDISILKEFQYREGYEPAEDFDLFERISSRYKIGFINEFLGFYRVHDNNTSSRKYLNLKKAEREIIKRQLDKYGFEYNEGELDLHLNFANGKFNLKKCSTAAYAAWFRKLEKQNKNKRIFCVSSFNLALNRQWVRICIEGLKTNWNIFLFFMRPINYRTFCELIK